LWSAFNVANWSTTARHLRFAHPVETSSPPNAAWSHKWTMNYTLIGRARVRLESGGQRSTFSRCLRAAISRFRAGRRIAPGHDAKDDQGEDGSDDRGDVAAEGDGHAEGGGHPDRGGGCEPLDLLAGAALDNRASAEKADSGEEALNDSWFRIVAEVGQVRHGDEQRRADGDEHVRANAGALAHGFSFEADHRPQRRGDEQTQGDASDVGGGVETVELGGDRVGDFCEEGHDWA